MKKGGGENNNNTNKHDMTITNFPSLFFSSFLKMTTQSFRKAHLNIEATVEAAEKLLVHLDTPRQVHRTPLE